MHALDAQRREELQTLEVRPLCSRPHPYAALSQPDRQPTRSDWGLASSARKRRSLASSSATAWSLAHRLARARRRCGPPLGSRGKTTSIMERLRINVLACRQRLSLRHPSLWRLSRWRHAARCHPALLAHTEARRPTPSFPTGGPLQPASSPRMGLARRAPAHSPRPPRSGAGFFGIRPATADSDRRQHMERPPPPQQRRRCSVLLRRPVDSTTIMTLARPLGASPSTRSMRLPQPTASLFARRPPRRALQRAPAARSTTGRLQRRTSSMTPRPRPVESRARGRILRQRGCSLQRHRPNQPSGATAGRRPRGAASTASTAGHRPRGWKFCLGSPSPQTTPQPSAWLQACVHGSGRGQLRALWRQASRRARKSSVGDGS